MENKRRRLLGAAGPGASVRSVERLRDVLLSEIGESRSFRAADTDGLGGARRFWRLKALKAPTPYGEAVRSMKIGELTVDVAHPAALLWHFANTNADFAVMVRDSNVDVNAIAVWHDEIVSGNVLRSDNLNKHVVMFWTCLSWPAYVRELSFGWLPLCVLPYESVTSLAGAHSELLRHIFHLLFTGEHNLRAGVVFRSPSAQFVFRGVPSAVLADEAALKQVYAVKGASGTLPCAACQNGRQASLFPRLVDSVFGASCFQSC